MRRRNLSCLLALGLAGCMSGPNYAPPKTPTSQALQSGAFLRTGEAVQAQPVAQWWQGLGDPQLNVLVEQGLRSAPAIEAARARVRQARANLASARTNLLPSAGASALYAHADLPSGSLGGTTGDIDLYNVGFDAQWEVDLWGGKRRGAEAARADALGAEARLADTQVGLSAEIARTYVSLRAAEARLVLLRERRDLDRQLAALAGQRVAAGTQPRQALEAAQSQLERSEGDLASASAEVMALRDSLAVLTGAAPGALDGLAAGPVPLPPAEVAIGDPAGMLARRPDIRAAERRLAASTARIGEAQAKRFPTVSFMGILGLGGTSPGDLFDASQASTILLPRLSWNFLNFGRTAAGVRGAEAGRDEALAEYRGSVLSALQDAEVSLARFGAARAVFWRSGRSAGHAAEIARLQDMRARAGTLSQVDALEARRQAVGASLAEIQDRASVTIAYVALAKSLGLGWTDVTAKTAVRDKGSPHD